ncbi:MAG TPA: exodeoxyribonuclease VII large subunit, partial [Motiliproteus sp.]
AAFEALKAKLDAEGLFAAEHKRPLPSLPRAIGAITSPSGAAIRDIISVLKRRFPAIPIYLYPSQVQGSEAAEQLCNALAYANRDQHCDVLILGRGGGAAEDLWPFNDERLARAIHASAIPVVSAVGHETDFSISDFVADLRAPTPSAAAELISPDREQLLRRLGDLTQRLHAQQQRQLDRRRQQLHWLSQRLRHPGQRLQQQAQQLDRLELRLHAAMRQRLNQLSRELSHRQERLLLQRPLLRIDQQRRQLCQLQGRLQQTIQQRVQHQRSRLAGSARALHAVSPLATLERGYAIVSEPSGRVISSVTQTAPGRTLKARLSDGVLVCQVNALESDTPVNNTEN